MRTLHSVKRKKIPVLVSKIYSNNAEGDSKHAANKGLCRQEGIRRLSENDKENWNFGCSVWETYWVKGGGTLTKLWPHSSVMAGCIVGILIQPGWQQLTFREEMFQEEWNPQRKSEPGQIKLMWKEDSPSKIVWNVSLGLNRLSAFLIWPRNTCQVDVTVLIPYELSQGPF